MPGNGASPTAAKRRLGQALARLREATGTSQEHMAEVLECSPAKIRRIEVGDVAVRQAELRVLLDHYGTCCADREPIEHLAREARKRRPRTGLGAALPGFFRRFHALEELATEVLRYQAELVPGPLQTPDYARALLTAHPHHRPDDVERLVEARMARLDRIIDGEQCLHVVLHEAAVRAGVGTRDVMRGQHRHLRELAALPNVTLQVLPLDAPAHALTGYPFVMLRFPDSDPIVYLEALTTAATVEDPSHITRYEEAFETLHRTALSPQKAATLLSTLERAR
ncbi:helix-turn-helix domain-containing protein [Saccharothrix variisporea]|uniref:Helix-turn-helix protein n=1 Tax=Saccharothrix variisporea TaxID=543527 RepID=A0A495X5D3_9PSEU|nr:helix-turn-helix transcriptional regulator [Saccharothrix variisporea]RKT68719.1 helix-turn-helix protein [Saccharothrix variisporea]